MNALFFQYRPTFSFLPDATFALGGRYNKTGENEISIWNVSGRIPIFADITFRGMAGTSFNLPTAEELYLDEDTMVGNPDLKPEESINIDIGLEGKFSIFNWNIGYYWRETDDEISANEDRTTYINADGETKYQGFDIQLGARLTDEIYALANLTTVDAKANGSSQQLVRTPEYVVKVNLQYTEQKGCWGAGIETQYVGKTVNRGYASYDPYQDEINYGEYFLISLSGFYAFGTENRHRLTLRIENLFDEHYATGINSIDVDSDRFTYKRYGMPFSAVVGYSFTF